MDVSHPQSDVWDFLREHVVRYDASVFSAPEFSQVLSIPQYMIHPAIDPLAEKNRDMTTTEVEAVLTSLGIRDDRPIVTQVSRFDRLKDPLGVIRAYQLVRRTVECQLVLAGGGAADDPEGAAVLEEVRRAADGEPLIHVLDLPPFSDREINALQRASAVVVQKSLREGFGLTVTEALWKRRPVVASAVGGIPLQVLHNLTGLLVHSVEGAAYRIRTLLRDPVFARRLGDNGHEYVKTRFLTTSNLRRWLALAHALRHPGGPGNALADPEPRASPRRPPAARRQAAGGAAGESASHLVVGRRGVTPTRRRTCPRAIRSHRRLRHHRRLAGHGAVCAASTAARRFSGGVLAPRLQR